MRLAAAAVLVALAAAPAIAAEECKTPGDWSALYRVHYPDSSTQLIRSPGAVAAFTAAMEENLGTLTIDRRKVTEISVHIVYLNGQRRVFAHLYVDGCDVLYGELSAKVYDLVEAAVGVPA